MRQLVGPPVEDYGTAHSTVDLLRFLGFRTPGRLGVVFRRRASQRGLENRLAAGAYPSHFPGLPEGLGESG